MKKVLSHMNEHRGFTLLLAALVASIVLALGTSTFAIVYKQVQLSAIGRDSQFAFYAADTAAECALDWDTRADLHPNTFATSTASRQSASQVACDGKTVPLTIAAQTATAATSTFEVDLFSNTTGGPYCADVSVGKSPDSNGGIRTVITSNGYNISCTALTNLGSTNDTVALQRSVVLKY